MVLDPIRDALFTRRGFMNLGTRALVAATFMSHAARTSAVTANVEDTLDGWKKRLGEAARWLGNRELSGLQWQQEMDRIFADVPLEQLLHLVNFDHLRASILQQGIGARGENFRPLQVPGVCPAYAHPEPGRILITKLAHVKKGRHIPPHGHSNMVSAFLCVAGEFEVQLYDRVEEDEDTMVVRKTTYQDRAGPGSWSSVSDYRDNVHWLTAKSENCFLFTCKLIRLEPDRPFHGRIHLDLRRPADLGQGTIRAVKISHRSAHEIY